MASRMAAVFVMVALGAAACGSPATSTGVASAPAPTVATAEPGTPAEPESPAESPTPTVTPSEPAWTVAELGAPGEDSSIAAVELEDRVVVVSTNQRGLVAWVDAGDGWLSADVSEGAPGGSTYLAAAGAVRGGVLVVLNNYETFIPQLWFSEDGMSWAQLSAEGIDRPTDVVAVAAVGDAVVMVGALRVSEDPSIGPFEPVIWRSEDLEAWNPTDLEASGEGIIVSVAATGSGLVAVGRDSRTSAMWRSEDDGRSWTVTSGSDTGVAEGLDLRDLAVSGETVVAVGVFLGDEDIDRIAITTSTDGGVSWIERELDPAAAIGLSGAYSVDYAAGAFWIITSRGFDAYKDVDRCYTDIAACQQSSQPVVLRSQDGVEWAEIDMAALDPPQHFSIDTVVGREDGAIVVGSTGNIRVWSWPSLASPPLGEPPDQPQAPNLELVVGDAQLEVGVTYRFPLYTHCGMGYLANFNGTNWLISEDVDSALDPSWPVAGETVLGLVTLVEDGTIEYSIPGGEVIATYEPSADEPSGCA